MTTSWQAPFRGVHAVYTVILSLAIGLHAIDVFVVATVLPSVVADIGGAAFYTWSSMLYMVASIVGAASGGRVTVGLGNRRGYVAAAGIFLIGSIGCALAPNMAFLLAARVAQGAGGGLITALSFALIGTLYPEAMRARMFAVISAMWGIAAVFGPFVGGIFAEIGWWRGAFWTGVPIILVFAGLAWRHLPDSAPGDAAPRFPWRRLTLLGAGVMCVALSGHIAAMPVKLGLLALAVAVVALTLLLDGRAPTNRLFPSRPVSLGHPVSTGYWLVFLMSITYSPVSVFMPLMIQELHGAGPLAAGYFYAILAFGWTAAAIVTSSFRGPWIAVAVLIGPPIMALGILGQSMVVLDGSLLLFGGFLAMTGIGIGICHAHIANLTISAARPGEEAITAGSIPTTQLLAMAFGAATGGLLANAAGLDAGISPATVAAATGWIYSFCIVPPLLASAMALRLVWLHRARAAAAISGGGL